jgi:cytochrome c biogenesis protein CcmG/thiol:disulfide interchange protein DsbE
VRFLIPAAVFVGIVALLAIGLQRDPRLVPSPLIGKPAPEFSLPRLEAPERSLGSADLRGRPALLNVWASWCGACREEHALLLAISQSGSVPIYGLNYKDQREDALGWLARLGNPYVATAYDAEGRVAIDFGVYGAPETFVIAADGTILYKHIGPLTETVWQERLLPLVDRLRAASR